MVDKTSQIFFATVYHHKICFQASFYWVCLCFFLFLCLYLCHHLICFQASLCRVCRGVCQLYQFPRALCTPSFPTLLALISQTEEGIFLASACHPQKMCFASLASMWYLSILQSKIFQMCYVHLIQMLIISTWYSQKFPSRNFMYTLKSISYLTHIFHL